MHAISNKKFFNLLFFSFAALALLSFSHSAKASEDDNGVSMHGEGPKITDISDIRNTSAIVNFRTHHHRFNNQTVTAIISIKDESTEILKERAAKVMLNDNGEGSIRITGLRSGTDYSFKVRILKDDDPSRSTRNSNDKEATTASSSTSDSSASDQGNDSSTNVDP